MSEHAAPVLETLDRSGLDPSSYLIFGGAVMAMRGIRPAQDIDLMVEQTIFKKMTGDLLTPGGVSLVVNAEALDEGEEYRLLSNPDDGSLSLDLRSLTKYQRMGAIAFTQWMRRGEDLETDLGTMHIMRLEDVFMSKVNSPRLKDREDAYMIHKHLTQSRQTTI